MINEYLLCPLCGKLPISYKELNFNNYINNINNTNGGWIKLDIYCSSHCTIAWLRHKSLIDITFHLNNNYLVINYSENLAQIGSNLNKLSNKFINLNLPLNIDLTLDNIQNLIQSYIIFQ